MSERWLVCGGRAYGDHVAIEGFLSQLVYERGQPEVLIHGVARGTDLIAGAWAKRIGVPVIEEPARAREWAVHGPAAGPMRNQRMIDLHAPTLVIAFPGGRGTADMTRRALNAGLPVIVAKPPATAARL